MKPIECEMLFCHNEAQNRLTGPGLKQGLAICKECLAEQLAHYQRKIRRPGAVFVDSLDR